MLAWEPASTGSTNALSQTLPSSFQDAPRDPLHHQVPNHTRGEPKPQGSVLWARSLSSAFFISALTYPIFLGKRYELPRAIDSVNTTIWCAADLPPVRASYIDRNLCHDTLLTEVRASELVSSSCSRASCAITRDKFVSAETWTHQVTRTLSYRPTCRLYRALRKHLGHRWAPSVLSTENFSHQPASRINTGHAPSPIQVGPYIS
jgi:hypothetical protein